MKKTSLTLVLVLFCYLAISQSRFKLQQNWSFNSHGDDLGKAGLVVKDLDKNGKPDVIASGTVDGENFETWGFFSIIEFDAAANTYKTKWTSRVFFAEITDIQLYDLDQDGADELLVGFNSGEVRIFDTSTYRLLRSFTTGRAKTTFSTRGILTIAMGDIDNDGANNFVATYRDTTYIYDMAFKLKQKFVMKGASITLANVDADNAIEAVYTTGDIIEYSATGAKKEYRFSPYPYNSSFGTNETVVRIADMNKDGTPDVLYSSQDTVHVVSVRTRQRIRSFAKKKSYGSVSDFQVFDYTNDGVPDVFMGNTQFDVLDVHNGATTIFDFSINDPKRNGLESLAIADLDNKPGMELLWTSGAMCSCADHFFVYDLGTRAMKWMSKSVRAGLQAFDFGSLSTSGNVSEELVIGTLGDFATYYGYGFLSALDAETKTVKRETTEPAQSPGEVTALTIGDIDNDGKNEILVGIETSYAFTSIQVMDTEFHRLRTWEVRGMSYVADIKVIDIDGDHNNEVIVTSGTNVAGSTNPEEYQNYIYIFDGKTGLVEWKSEQVAGLSSHVGNVLVGNVDRDPALEIVMLRYNKFGWTPKPAAIYVIDGWTHSLSKHEGEDYSALSLDDFDKDGTKDIIAATSTGKILALDGQSFAVKKEIASGKGNITAMHAIDLNGDQAAEYVFTSAFKLQVLDAVHGSMLAETDTLGKSTGNFGSIRVRQTKTGATEILVNAGHTLFSFQVESLPNARPSPFALLSPANKTIQEPTAWLEFSWGAAIDGDPVTYSLHLTGPGLDTVVQKIPHTHLAFRSSRLKKDVQYSWSVEATDGQLSITSATFAFQISDPIILGVEQNPDHGNYGIYPNPFSNVLVVENTSRFEIEKIRIVDRNGIERVAKQVHVQPQSETSVEEVASLPAGMYLCSLISSRGEVHTVKIMKY